VPGLEGLPEHALVVPNAGDLTWAEVSLDPATVASLPAGLAEVADASARAVLWVALLGAVSRAEVDPRVAVDVFERAWPHERAAAVLTRTARALTTRVVPMFLPPAEQEAALARVAGAADALLARTASSDTPGSGALAVAAARVWAGSGSDVDRLRRWAAGDGIPAALEGDDDFRWSVLRRLAALGSLGEDEIERAEAADRSLAGSLAALGVRAVRPTAEAKEWAWSRLRDDAELSNYAALAVAGGFWVTPDPELVRHRVDEVGDLVVGLSGRMGDDALSRVVTAIHPTRLVDEGTATASAEILARGDLTPGVRRALVDADHDLREALASRHRFG
jgi:aminopeptidase N